MPRPSLFPRWATVPTVDPATGQPNIIEPSEGLKDTGYLRTFPARQHANWLHKIAYDWLNYLDEQVTTLLGIDPLLRAQNLADLQSLPTALKNIRAPFIADHFVHQNTPADMRVIVEPGTFMPPTRASLQLAARLSPLIVAPTANPRFTLVSMNIDGTVIITNGAEAATPAVPTVPVLAIPLAVIPVFPGQTTIIDSQITDWRIWPQAEFGVLTGNGWLRFQNGVMLQWGQVTTTTNANETKNFPTAFPNVGLQIMTNRADCDIVLNRNEVRAEILNTSQYRINAAENELDTHAFLAIGW